MAHLLYGAECAPIDIPDHLLAHVKIVIATKLRRNESFMMSWRHADGSGRSAIWLQPSIPLRFVFEVAEPPVIDRKLLAGLAESANSNAGLVLTLDDLAATEVAQFPTRAAEPELAMASGT